MTDTGSPRRNVSVWQPVLNRKQSPSHRSESETWMDRSLSLRTWGLSDHVKPLLETLQRLPVSLSTGSTSMHQKGCPCSLPLPTSPATSPSATPALSPSGTREILEWSGRPVNRVPELLVVPPKLENRSSWCAFAHSVSAGPRGEERPHLRGRPLGSLPGPPEAAPRSLYRPHGGPARFCPQRFLSLSAVSEGISGTPSRERRGKVTGQ